MLNDFGFSVPLGSTYQFAGTLRHAPDSVLQQLASHYDSGICSVPEHNLESLVKMLLDAQLEGDPRLLRTCRATPRIRESCSWVGRN
jgi:hypothetical protein